MQLFRKIIALLILPFLSVIVFAFLVGTTANDTLLNGSFLKSELRKANVYEQGVREARNAITTKYAPVKENGGLSITPKNLDAAVTDIIEPTWLQREVESNIDSLNRWLNSSGTLSLTVRLTDRKPIILTHFDALLKKAFTAAGPCAQGAPPPDSLQQFCLPAGTSYEQIRAELKKQGVDPASYVAALPDVIDLLNPQQSLNAFILKIGGTQTPATAANSQVAQKLDEFRTSVTTFRSGLSIAIIALFIITGLELFLVALGKKTFFKWSGMIVFVISLFPLVVGIAGVTLAPIFILQKLPRIQVLAETRTAIETLINGILSGIFVPLVIYGATLFVIGAGLWVASSFVTQRTHERPLTTKN